MRADLAVLPSAAALADATAARFVAAAEDAIASRGQFIVALSGGSTPRDTYRQLATEALVSRVMRSRVQVLWGDERRVPPDHMESNYRMARDTLLDRVPVPAGNVHRILGEDAPTSAAAAYEATLPASLRTPAGTRTALVLLGPCGDRHTPPLFPRTAAVSPPAP